MFLAPPILRYPWVARGVLAGSGQRADSSWQFKIAVILCCHQGAAVA